MKSWNNKLIKSLPIILVIVLGLCPIIWFWGRGNVLINGIDTNFPLDPYQWFIRRFFVWNNLFNGGVDFSSSISGLFFHLVQVIPYKLGLSLQVVELFSLIFWFVIITLSSFFFAKTILPGAWLVQLLFVVFYTFNIYLFNSWENVKVSNLSLIASATASLAVITKLKENKLSKKQILILGVLIGLILSGSGINPSYFFTFLLIVLIYFLGLFFVDGQKTDLLKKAALFLLIIFFVNAFWIIPLINFTQANISPVGTIDKLGLTNWIDSLSEHTSLLNVMRVQGAWDWYAVDGLTGQPLYIPYALNYFYKLPFLAFSFLIPALALTSFLFLDKSRKYLYISFGVMLVIGIFLGSGTHLPTGDFYRILIDHLPFFTIFRSPWYIFTPLLLIAYAGLISLLLYNLVKLKKNQLLTHLLVGILLVGNLIYCYPLITGKIFRPGREDSFYVNFPSYIFDTKKWLDSQDFGRIITYPDDEIEQFSWGYRGIESILSLLSNKEFLYSSINAPDAPISKLIKQFYKNLVRGEIKSADNLADKMAAGIIFEKNDQKSLSPKISTQVFESLNINFGPWYFYNLTKNNNHSKLRSVSKVFLGYPYSGGAELLTLLGRDELLVNPDDSEFMKMVQFSNLNNLAIKAENSQAGELASFNNSVSQLNNRLLTRDLSKVNFDFNIPKESVYQPNLERYKIEDFGLSVSVGKSMELELDGSKQNWEVTELTDSLVSFKPIKLTKGQHRVVLKLNNRNLIKGGDFEGAVEFNQKGQGVLAVEKIDTGHLLDILNKNSGAPETSADFNVYSFDPLSSYLIEVKYQQVYGNNASVIVYQSTPNTLVKAQTERLPNYPQLNNFSFFYDPVKTQSSMVVSLLAPYIKDPLGTKVLYDDLTVYKVFTNQMFLMESNESKTLPAVLISNAKNQSPVLYEANVNGGSAPHIINFAENYSPQWELSIYDENGRQLNIKTVHFSGDLFANAWIVEGAPDKYKAKIYFQPQNLLILGFAISALTIIWVAAYTFLDKLRRKQT